MKKWILLAFCAVIALSIISCNSTANDPAVTTTERFNIASGYDMDTGSGIRMLKTDYFRLMLPEDLGQYELGAAQPAYEELVFTYWPAENDKLEADLFSVKGYELNDERYKELENYIDAGQAGGRRIIIEFRDSSDIQGSKHEKRYNELKAFFEGLEVSAQDGVIIMQEADN